jgi:hypothetical protein
MRPHGRKVLFLIHRDVLAEQTAKTFQGYGLDCGFIMGSKKSNPNAPIQIASVQTLARRKEIEFNADLIFYDEAHITAYSRFGLENIKNDLWHVGLTATPFRLKKTEGMGDLFEGLVHTPLPLELMEMGYLIRPKYFTLQGADLSGVRITAGDYNISELGTVCNDSAVIDSFIENWCELAYGRRTIVFTVNVAHSKATASKFNEKGIAAAAVYGEMPINQRNEIYSKLEQGIILVVVACEAVAEGFDVPAIECVGLTRPTKSRAKAHQQIGRGVRISPNTNKTDCIILDQAGLVAAFGPIEYFDKVELINGKTKNPVTCFCENCGCGVPPNVTLCVRCAEKKLKDKNLPIGKMTELIILIGQRREFEFYRGRLKIAYHKHYSPGYATMKFYEHYKKYPPLEWGLGAVFGDEPTEKDKKDYLFYLKMIASQKAKDSNWITRNYYYQFRENP